MRKKVIFRGVALPYLLLAPQMAVTLIFFFWPAGMAVWQSTLRQDAFGLRTEFVAFENFLDLFQDPIYLNAAWNTAIFSTSVAALALGAALFLAVQADKHVVRQGRIVSVGQDHDVTLHASVVAGGEAGDQLAHGVTPGGRVASGNGRRPSRRPAPSAGSGPAHSPG